MSEKTLFDLMKKKLKPEGWKLQRLENCNTKGIPDTIVRHPRCRAMFVELKDWSQPKKHPLSTEQRNILVDFKGVVFVRTRTGYYVVDWDQLAPLLACDTGHAETFGKEVRKNNFCEDFYDAIY